MVTIYNTPLSTTSEKALFGRPGRGAQKSVVAHKSLFYNKLATYRVDETITLKIAYYLISNDLRATPKLNARLSPAWPAGSCRKGLSSARRG